MNNTPNYAYLTGYLESVMRSLADNYTFLDMANYTDRKEYINKLIQIAHQNAIEHNKID